MFVFIMIYIVTCTLG